MHGPSQGDPLAQRCDLILDPKGALRIVLAGDWIAPHEGQLVRRVLGDVTDHGGPVALDTAGMGRVAGEIAAAIEDFRANYAPG